MRGPTGPSSGERRLRPEPLQLPAIVRELEKATIEIARLVEEGERQAEIEHERREAPYERWRREEEAWPAAKAVNDSKEELLEIIDAWAAAKRLDEFFAAPRPLLFFRVHRSRSQAQYCVCR